MDSLILLVEDDEAFGQPLKDFLALNGFVVEWAKDGSSAVTLFRESNPRLVLLDVQLPGKDGFEVAVEIRKSNSIVPLIFMTGTAKDAVYYNKAFHSLRAVNYMEKPILPQKLLAQINGLLQPAGVIKYEKEGYQIIVNGQLLTINNRVFKHSAKEIQVFSLLLDNINSLVSRKDILLQVWKNDDYEMNSSLDSAIRKIRKSLHEFPAIQIKTFYSEGFKLFFETNG